MGDTHELTLPDGRRMTYADHGDPAGPVVLECVGTPQSRLPWPGQAELVAGLGFRLLVPDRPGVGGSDPQPGRTLTDWPADAAALLDAHGVDRCGVIGGSGGGPYAVACGVELPDRIAAVALVAPAAPSTAPVQGFVPSADPVALRERGETIARLLDEGPDALEAFFSPDLSESDRGQHTDPSELENLREFFRQGVDAYVEDHTLVGGDWAGLLPRLTRPTRIWQGDDDNNVPVRATRWLAGQIPGAELTVLSGGGHSFADDVFPGIYGWLVTATTSTSKPAGPSR